MIKKVEVFTASREVLGNPTPLGLIGLAIGCAALTPIAFGISVTPTALTTGAVWAVLFGAGCQLLSGLMNFVNKNTFGGTIFTAFSFLWMVNAWTLYSVANGTVPDHSIGLATEIVLLVIFAVLTYGFGFFSNLLFAFLVVIDLLFVVRIIKSVTATTLMNVPIGILTVLMGAIGLWLAFASLINPVSGRQLFKMGGPLFFAPKAQAFDWKIRFNLFDILYRQWREHAFQELPIDELRQSITKAIGGENIVPDLYYLQDFGYLVLTFTDEAETEIQGARLNAKGIDLYEQLVLKKYD